MGIQGLLKLLEPITQKKSLESYRGQKMAIDAYCWLHKAAYTCSYELVTGKYTEKHIEFCVNKIKMLQHFDIEPIVVLDGADHCSKDGTNSGRHAARNQLKLKADQLMKEGKKKEAYELYKKCVDITPEIAFQLILKLRELKIKYIVAPYEADAQLAFLSLSGQADVVLTEDSDLIVFGCKKVLFKLNDKGFVDEIDFDNIKNLKETDMKDWDLKTFRRMCILSGCDYLPSIPKVGLKTAHKLVKRHKGDIKRILNSIKNELSLNIEESYYERFILAELTFQHHFVFEVTYDGHEHLHAQLKPLTDIDQENIKPEEVELLEKATGYQIDDSLIMDWAKGDINPLTLKPINLTYNINQPFTDNKENQQPKIQVKKQSFISGLKQQCKSPDLSHLSKLFQEDIRGSIEPNVQVSFTSSPYFQQKDSSVYIKQSNEITNKKPAENGLESDYNKRQKLLLDTPNPVHLRKIKVMMAIIQKMMNKP